MISNITFHSLISIYIIKKKPSFVFTKNSKNLIIISYSTETEVKYNNKRILEIISSIKDTQNFKIAFTHKSLRLTNAENKSYDVLEFLGDSLLSYYTTKFLFFSFTEYNEGDLTSLRSLLVERKNLARISKEIELDKFLNLDKGVEKSKKILADIYESFIAALYLEKGEGIVQEFLCLTILNRPETKDFIKDYKFTNDKDITNKIPFINEHKVNKIPLNSMKELTFKFIDNDNKVFEDQKIFLEKISKYQESNYSFLNLILKQLASLKEIVFGIKTFEDNFNNKYFNTINEYKIAYSKDLQIKDNTYKLINNLHNYMIKFNDNSLNTISSVKDQFNKLNKKIFFITLLLSLLIPILIGELIVLYLIYVN